jgi:hypothetical protein
MQILTDGLTTTVCNEVMQDTTERWKWRPKYCAISWLLKPKQNRSIVYLQDFLTDVFSTTSFGWVGVGGASINALSSVPLLLACFVLYCLLSVAFEMCLKKVQIPPFSALSPHDVGLANVLQTARCNSGVLSRWWQLKLPVYGIHLAAAPHLRTVS